MERPMWTCPDCSRQFHNVNNAHSCIACIGVEDHLVDKPPGVSEAYRRFEAMVREIGPITVEPLKSRIAFKARTTFAGATFTKGTLRAGWVLARRIDDPRLKVDTYGGRHVHTLEVTAPEQLTDDIRPWLEEAYRLGTEGAGKACGPS
jgi:hypothetical protein